MNRKKAQGAKTQTASSVRASITFPSDVYQSLEDLAKQKKVSLAWVVRDAAEKYIADESTRTSGFPSDQRRQSGKAAKNL